MHRPRRVDRLLFVVLLLLCAGWIAPLPAQQIKEVTVYPSYGYRDGPQWVIPLRIWVHEPRQVAEAALAHLVARLEDRPAPEIDRFRDRLSDLIADDESRERVALMFDADPRQLILELQDTDGKPLRSDLNGLIVGELRLGADRAEELLRAQGSTHGWLRLLAVSPGQRGAGKVHLIAPHGLSLISDIDDTIKVTEIPAGREVVMENTFFRPFVPALGMVGRFRGLGADTAFHYVSGGPWQLYRALAEFIAGAGFPDGSFHMKSVRKNLLTPGSWQDLARLAGGDATTEQKLAQISGIIGHFPERRFVLVGDSGEQDPEVYREIRDRFPQQVEAIWIRDVVDARHRHPERLNGMQIIEVP